jgi:hypothetical protein
MVVTLSAVFDDLPGHRKLIEVGRNILLENHDL